ncbi:MAG: hypothetical protein GWP91_22100 [Rhodobacterales bacterium]|nr:hypothetical protein [Rhodobacterales bacterium]
MQRPNALHTSAQAVFFTVGLAMLMLPAVASAGQIKIEAVTASSSFPPEEGASYEPTKIKDGKAGSSWVEGDSGSGLGSWIELDLGGAHTVKEIKVWAGMWYSAEFWERGNRPKELEITLADGTKTTCALADEMKPQTCAIGKSTTSVKVKVKGVHSGTTWLDTAISEIQVWDDQVNTRAPVSAYEVSSGLPSDADGNYELVNTTDGIIDTMWCEGSKDGDGVGEWIEFSFDKSRKVSKLELMNGIGGSVKYWMLGNRATKATLEFSDGTKIQVEIKNSGRLQTIEFGTKATSKVRITFDEVYKGKEYNDLCISEAYFLE